VKTTSFVLTVFVLLFQPLYALPEPLTMALAGGGLMGIAALVRRSVRAHPAPVQAWRAREVMAEAGRRLAGHTSRVRRLARHV
jgi:small-conductance mechanosensitive channel